MRKSAQSLPRAAIFVLGVLIAALPAAAGQGLAVRIIDGDTIQLGRDKIRLDGIDAPELAQSCKKSAGKTWSCGKASKAYLERLASAGPVTCHGDELDVYSRRIATCHVRGRNLNAEMVRSGQALAFRRYSAAYVLEEDAAHLEGTGLWAGEFEAPWDYRAQKWQVAAQTGPENCPIKGNISGRGKIYHTPWSRHYSRTRINKAAGERWFCSEADAIAAGWRAPE
ncbi:thermonuclease family protein [Roseibium algae]|uniref:Thermonuclease family protein n=1 Tax=Roseibium algae TaxID=3123038 RepID=A0ABU8TIA2_9HYPH